MKHIKYLIIGVCLNLILVNSSQAINIFTKIIETATGEGLGEITDLGEGKFDIAVCAGITANRGETIKKWERSAKSACKGGNFKVIERNFDTNEWLLLTGIIQCSTISQSSNGLNNGNGNQSVEAVKNSQIRLKELGYSPGEADSFIGPSTKLAVEEFQKENNLFVTGYLDKQTLEKMQSPDAKHKGANLSDDVQVALPQSHANENDITAKLREFNQLKQDGVITEEEFIVLKEKAMKEYLKQ